MDFSKRITKEAKDYNIEPQAVVLADLLAVGYTEAEAYNIAYADNCVLTFEQNQSIRNALTTSQKFMEMAEDRKRLIRSRLPTSIKEEDIELMSTEEAAKQVLMAAKSLPTGSKERGEMFVKYTELLRKNTSVDAEPEDESIRIYLPLKCCDCQLYQDHIESRKEAKEMAKEVIETNEEENSEVNKNNKRSKQVDELTS